MAYRKIDGKVKDECVRLRVEKRLSIKRIKEITGISQGTLSRMLREYPLSAKEIHDRSSASATKVNKEARFRREKYLAKESRFHKMLSNPDSLTTAKISESAILFRLFVHGFSMYGSLFDGEKSDWIAMKDGKVFKIQVKTASLPQAGHKSSFKVTAGKGKPYKSEDFDYIIAYDVYTDEAFVYGWDEVKGQKVFTNRNDAKERFDKIV
jgi:transposase-like protein